jgi:predicted metal-dependent peptidase
MNRTPIADRITACLRTLILDEPFFGSLALHLKIKAEESIGTFATNGTDLIYAPSFASTLSDKENTYVLAHEVLHCALGHLWRRGDRCPQKWNVACDYIVNATLNKHIRDGCTVMSMPSMALSDPKYDGMSAEEIYNRLPQSASQPPPQPQPTGEFTDPPPPEPDEDGEEGEADPQAGNVPAPSTMSEGEWKIATIQAKTAQNASGQGHIGSDMDRMIKEHITPTIPWQEHLREFTNAITRDDYTWTRPNTRYIASGFVLPTLHSESVGDIVIAIDTSGSVNDALLARFLSETQALLDTAKPSSIHILSCDTYVKNAQTFHHGDDITKYVPAGGGGTRFEPVFRHIKDNDIDPIALIYFTDGYGSFPSTEPHYPTLWLHYGGQVNYPFGQVLEIPPAQRGN